jgi:hypothetical protein
MVDDATARRRWFGALVLLAALGILICGLTVLDGRLQGLAFMLYWLACFALTSLAVVVALLDARAIQRRIREEHRGLFQATLKEMEHHHKTKPSSRDQRPRGS